MVVWGVEKLDGTITMTRRRAAVADDDLQGHFSYHSYSTFLPMLSIRSCNFITISFRSPFSFDNVATCALSASTCALSASTCALSASFSPARFSLSACLRSLERL